MEAQASKQALVGQSSVVSSSRERDERRLWSMVLLQLGRDGLLHGQLW